MNEYERQWVDIINSRLASNSINETDDSHAIITLLTEVVAKLDRDVTVLAEELLKDRGGWVVDYSEWTV